MVNHAHGWCIAFWNGLYHTLHFVDGALQVLLGVTVFLRGAKKRVLGK